MCKSLTRHGMETGPQGVSCSVWHCDIGKRSVCWLQKQSKTFHRWLQCRWLKKTFLIRVSIIKQITKRQTQHKAHLIQRSTNTRTAVLTKYELNPTRKLHLAHYPLRTHSFIVDEQHFKLVSALERQIINTSTLLPKHHCCEKQLCLRSVSVKICRDSVHQCF